MARNTYITVAEAATLLRRSKGRIRAYIADGQIEAVKFGAHSWMIDPKALKSFKSKPIGRPKNNLN